MFGGLIDGMTSLAKGLATAPARAASWGAKLGIDVVTLPMTLTTKALAKAVPSVFGPVDRTLGQVKGLGKGAVEAAEQAVTFVPKALIGAQGRVAKEVVDTPFRFGGAVLGLKAPF